MGKGRNETDITKYFVLKMKTQHIKTYHFTSTLYFLE